MARATVAVLVLSACTQAAPAGSSAPTAESSAPAAEFSAPAAGSAAPAAEREVSRSHAVRPDIGAPDVDVVAVGDRLPGVAPAASGPSHPPSREPSPVAPATRDAPPEPSTLPPPPAAADGSPGTDDPGAARSLALLDGRPVLPASTTVVVGGDPGARRLEARVDTGAARSSVDRDAVAHLRLEVVGTVTTRSANGRREREVVRLPVRVGERQVVLEVTLADRSGMTYPVLLGRDLLRALDAVVDPVAGDGPLRDHTVVTETVDVLLVVDGDGVTHVARVDTGAARTVVDDDVAAALGGVPADAEHVRVRSSLGTQRRPLLPLALHLVGRSQDLQVSVTDRGGLRHAVLLGRDAMTRVLVDVVAADDGS